VVPVRCRVSPARIDGCVPAVVHVQRRVVPGLLVEVAAILHIHIRDAGVRSQRPTLTHKRIRTRHRHAVRDNHRPAADQEVGGDGRGIVRESGHADVAVIEIYGDIGESWWSEGITLKSITKQLNEITAAEIELRVSSLGGDAFDALSIHDALKMHKAFVKTIITGATASAATIVAMAGDTVEMSDNALFLIHNAWTWAIGDSDDLQEVRDVLDTLDERLANIYFKRIEGKGGDKTLQDVKDLMREDKWITAEEAEEWGLVDAVFEPKAVAASYDPARLKAVKERFAKEAAQIIKQKFEKMDTFENISNVLEVENIELTDDSATFTREQLQAIDAACQDPQDVAHAVAEHEQTLRSEFADERQQLQEQVTQAQTERDTAQATVTERDATVAALTQERDEAQNRITELEGQLSRANARGLQTEATGEPEIGRGDKLTPKDKMRKKQAEELKARMEKWPSLAVKKP